MDTLKIGGVEHEVRFRYVTCQDIMLKFNKVFTANKYDPAKNRNVADLRKMFNEQRSDLLIQKEAGNIGDDEYRNMFKKLTAHESSMISAVRVSIPDRYFFEAAWRVLEKRGVWPFRKPFRSMRHMIREMNKDEAAGAVQMIGEKILGYKTEVQTDDKKKQEN